MIEILVALGAGLAGSLVFRKRRPRCGARVVLTKKDAYGYKLEFERRCREASDPRCKAMHCTMHCRSQERCRGICLAADDCTAKDLLT